MKKILSILMVLFIALNSISAMGWLPNQYPNTNWPDGSTGGGGSGGGCSNDGVTTNVCAASDIFRKSS
jgi:hypothetical protein